MTAALLLVGAVVLAALAAALWRLMRDRKPAAADDLPPDRIAGEGDNQRVYRAFRVPATATVEAFTDALDLTLEEAASWDPKTEKPPPAIRLRQQVRYRNWLRARKGTPSRVRTADDGEAPKLTACPARVRLVSPITTASKRVQLPGTQPHRRSRPPLKTVGHYPLGGVRQLPNFIIGDTPGVERRCSCGAHFQGSAEDVAERWQAHLHADERTFGSKAADRVFAWLEKRQERVEGRAASVNKARSLLKATSLLSVLFFLALSIDARRSGRWEHDFKDPLIRSIAEAARSVGATSSTITASAAGGSSNTNGAWVGAVQPTSSDDVIIDGTSAGITIPSAVTFSCRSLNATGGKLTFAATTSNLNVGDASGGACTFSNTSTVTLTGRGTINFLATTGSTTYSLTTGGKTMPNLTVNTASTTTIQFADAVTATNGTVKLTAGIVDFNSKSVTCGTWTYTAGTVTTGTQTITCTGNGTTFTGGGQSWSGVSLTGSGLVILSGTSTFVNLTRTGTVTTTDSLQLGGSQTVSGTLTLGSAAGSSLLVHTGTLTSGVTLTVNTTVTINNRVCFRDITGAGSASWNLSASSAGDCLGNSGITFPVGVTRFAVATGNFSSTATWSALTGGAPGASVPLPQDAVVLNAASGVITVTQDLPDVGVSLTCTSFTGTYNISTATNGGYSLGANVVYGNVILAAGTLGGTQNLSVSGRSNSALTFSSGGATLPNGLILIANGSTFTAQDALAATGTVTDTAGVLVMQGFTLTCSIFTGSGTTYGGRGLTSTGSISCAVTTASTAFGVSSGGFTATLSSATIAISSASTNTRTFAGGGKTYGTLAYTAAGSTGSLTITGANTFTTINFSDATNARTLILPASTVTTVTGSAGFNVQGLTGKRMTVNSSTGATAATLSLSATADTAYCDYQDITATGSTLLARRGRDISGNSGITFPTIPVFDAAAAGTSSNSASSLTFSATVNAGTNRLLRIGVSLLNATSQTVTGVTYGGVALTSIGSIVNGTAARSEMWYLVAPAVGTANVVVSLSAAAAVAAGADSWSNVDQGAPIGLWTTATGTSSAPSVVVVSSTLEQVLDVPSTAAVDLIVGAGQTQDWNNAAIGVTGAGSRGAGTTSKTMGWTSTLSGVWATGAAPMFGALVVSTNLAGSSTPTGAVVGTIKKFLSGAETPAGAVRDTASKLLAGSETPSGALRDTAVKAVSGSMTPSGGVIQTADKGLSGSVTPSGQVRDTVSQHLTGSETPTGVVAKTASTHMTGSETPTGAVSDTPVKALGGSETPTGAVVRTADKALGGTEIPGGSVTKNASIHLSGSETPTGSVARILVRKFAGSLTPSGILHTTPAKAFGGVLAPIGRLLLEAVHFIRDRRSCEVPTPTSRRNQTVITPSDRHNQP